MQESDICLLREAYFEALQAAGNSDPNPAVGAVVTDEAGVILSRGFTQRAGYAHAERMALQNSDQDFLGKTLYVTLEPCCHHGRTPPCTDIIREKGIGRVVIGERDFAAEVMGQSVGLLRQNGITVDLLPEGQLAMEKLLTTGPFFHARRLQRPRVILKWAQTKDGAIAPLNGPSGKISGVAAAAVTAALRNYCKCTLATPGTVQSDRPRLDVRFPEASVDFRRAGFSAVFAQLLKTQLQLRPTAENSKAFKQPHRGYLTYPLHKNERDDLLKFQNQIGPDFFLLEKSAADLRHTFDLTMRSVLTEILRRGFNSVLIEAGARFSQSLLDANLADLLVIYQSKDLSAQNLWGSAGRGNTASIALAKAKENHPHLTGFHLIEKADLDSDLCYVFERRADD